MPYDSFLLLLINKANARPNGRKLRRRERSLEREVQAELDRQRDRILSGYKKLVGKGKGKAFSTKKAGEIEDIFNEIDPELLIQIVLDHSQSAMEFGAQYRIKTDKLGEIGITFDLLNPLAVEYLETDRPLVLSTLEQTTKDEIIPILQEALDSGQSYNDTASQIRDSFAFSSSRSQMIAVNEIGHAYEWGNYVPMKDAQTKGYKIEKSWLTVGDDRVTEECHANERMSWILLDKPFDSGDDTAPRDSNPRCRCTTLYRYSQ